ncbi:zinc-finger of the MIZ type in Nse subunit-domain-containing protein [Xylariaceae sp. FL0016]|nr:zinc-finger of the MIZ type in Nse subunit-domain-containing protein [Xylariaceae sp. FL0016]
MSSRSRLLQSSQRNRGRPSKAAAFHGAAELPDYEPPSFPLDPSLRRALADLSSNANSLKYEAQLTRSIKLLTSSVSDINDKYAKRKETLKRMQLKREQTDADKSKRERREEEALLNLRESVPELTEDCDKAVQSVIDMKNELQDHRQAMQDMSRKVEFEAANAAQEPQARHGEDEDGMMADAVPHPDVVGPLRILENEKRKAADDYATRTPYEKYALDNDYVGFKGMWHDAVHGKEGKPLPDASKWFTQNGAEEEDDDEDLVVAEEHLSMRCPLSLVDMTEPYTSRICKHTFNKPEIVDYLRRQPGGKAKCPQIGCNKELSIGDLFDDQIKLRRIKRAQANDEDEEEGNEDEDEEGDISMKVTQSRNIKQERARDRGRQLIDQIEAM